MPLVMVALQFGQFAGYVDFELIWRICVGAKSAKKSQCYRSVLL